MVPDSAPFSPQQRAWLNGFFAGVFGTDAKTIVPDGVTTSAANNANAPSPVALATVEPEDFPWHDPAMPLDERLQLAEGKPLERKLMAAMAQLDCGACGYLCQTYSEAIVSGAETDLTKCVPGGKDTTKKLRELVTLSKTVNGSNATSSTGAAFNGTDQPINGQTNGAVQAAMPNIPISELNTSNKPAYNRQRPFTARVKSVDRLNKDGSEKDIRHVVIDLADSGLTYEPGDAVGVYPINCIEQVDQLLQRLGWKGDALHTAADGSSKTLRERLLLDHALSKVNNTIVGLVASCAINSAEGDHLRMLAEVDDKAFLDSADLLDVLQACPSSKPTPSELLPQLTALQPRLYSISSSLRMHPGEVHLTIGVVRYQQRERYRKGVCSTFFAERVEAGDQVRVFIQASHGFRLPTDNQVPIIMVGPGTGIAPFRAFLEERTVARQHFGSSGTPGQNEVNSCGESWLFFGDQRMSTDFLYEQELQQYQQCAVLTRFCTAFSRDQTEKIYVQTKMKEQGAELWNWLERGAYFYVCGDAKRMAPDVDAALHEIIVQHGGRTPADAKAYLQSMRQAKRYRRDVY